MRGLVAVWKTSDATKILDVNVPAGGAAPLSGGFRWVELTTPIVLDKNTVYTVAGQTFGDEWKDSQAPGADTYAFAGLVGALPYGTPADNYEPWHRWGGDPDAIPTGNAGWGWNRHYVAGNVAFAVIPEPASIAALASATLMLRRRRSL